jgi:hypothetical protein
MTVLIIGEDERALIAELRAVVEAREPMTAADLLAVAAADIEAFRDAMNMQSVDIPIGYVATYSIEVQPNAPPPGICRHISISVDRPGKLPHPAAVDMILEAFGMQPIAKSSKVWIEDICPGQKAINVLQLATA